MRGVEYRFNFCFDGMGLDIAKERSEKKPADRWSLFFIGVPPRHQSGCFLTSGSFLIRHWKNFGLDVLDPDSWTTGAG
jgi:hypothetical protein